MSKVVSKKEMLEVDNKLLDEMRIAKESNMPSSPQEWIQVVFLDAENDIQSGYFVGLHLTEQVVHHLADYIGLASVFEVFS